MGQGFYVDLHIHSFFSDGTLSPEEIVEQAEHQGVAMISVTDHNQLAGARRLQSLSSGSDLICIPGVELDATYFGVNIHILGYQVDLEDAVFQRFTEENAKLLESANVQLVRRMEADSFPVSLDEYTAFSYDRTKGGWKALHYFMQKGLAGNVGEAFAYYSRYGSAYDCIRFPGVEEVCRQIHRAGGVAILAHPGKVFASDRMDDFERKIRDIITLGVDGVECYYPSHSDQVTEACLRVCRDADCLITSGSDCHGDFEDTQIGQMHCDISKLKLDNIWG